MEEALELTFTSHEITAQLTRYFRALRSFYNSQLLQTNSLEVEPKPYKNYHTTAEMSRSLFGFSLVKQKSGIANAGFGLFLEGEVTKGTCVCIYPGVVYQPGDPIFLPSLKNG
jgi:hypothetical protein